MTKPLTAPGDLISYQVGRITITVQWIRTGVYTVTVYQGGTLRVEDLCGSYGDEDTARAVARGYAKLYSAEVAPAPVAEPAPAPVLRTGHVAALANLRFAGWTVKAIAAELKVSTRSVYKWLAGSNPSPARREALTALNYGLRSTGAGCGCGGVGWIHTGESWTGGRLAPTYVRCSCNKERETDA